MVFDHERTYPVHGNHPHQKEYAARRPNSHVQKSRLIFNNIKYQCIITKAMVAGMSKYFKITSPSFHLRFQPLGDLDMVRKYKCIAHNLGVYPTGFAHVIRTNGTTTEGHLTLPRTFVKTNVQPTSFA